MTDSGREWRPHQVPRWDPARGQVGSASQDPWQPGERAAGRETDPGVLGGGARDHLQSTPPSTAGCRQNHRWVGHHRVNQPSPGGMNGCHVHSLTVVRLLPFVMSTRNDMHILLFRCSFITMQITYTFENTQICVEHAQYKRSNTLVISLKIMHKSHNH